MSPSVRVCDFCLIKDDDYIRMNFNKPNMRFMQGRPYIQQYYRSARMGYPY